MTSLSQNLFPLHKPHVLFRVFLTVSGLVLTTSVILFSHSCGLFNLGTYLLLIIYVAQLFAFGWEFEKKKRLDKEMNANRQANKNQNQNQNQNVSYQPFIQGIIILLSLDTLSFLTFNASSCPPTSTRMSPRHFLMASLAIKIILQIFLLF